jgi:hypothetical protein
MLFIEMEIPHFSRFAGFIPSVSEEPSPERDELTEGNLLLTLY